MTVDLREKIQSSLGDTYTLERELGGGGMSRVFVAGDARLGRTVVMKVLHADLAEGMSAERFKREIHLAARLQHPHIVPLLDGGELPTGVLYYTMPYVEGASLRERLAREGALPVSDVVAILRDVASALACAHRQHVVHRDIKPENILVSEGGAVVTDFGIAKAIRVALEPDGVSRATTTITRRGTSLGTPAYMAPEQAAGDAVDPRADLYALGVVAYEMLAGRAPFDGRTAQQLLAAHASEEPEAILKRRPNAPVSLAALVMRLLEKNPADRPQTADELLRALDDVATAQITTTPPAAASRGAPVLGAVRRSASVVGALSAEPRIALPWALFFVTLVVALWLALGRTQSVPATPLVAAIGAPAGQELQPASNSAFSPEGERLAFVAADAQGRTAIWVRLLDSVRAVRIDQTDGASFPFWSPDGGSLGFFADGRLKTVDLRGGAPRVLCPASYANGGAWTKDNVIVYSPFVLGTLYRVDAAGGPCTQLTSRRPGDIDHRRPSPLPDGRVLFSSYRLNTALVVDTKTGVIQELRRPGRDAKFAAPNWLVFRDEENGPLYAQRFDLQTLRMLGEPRIVAERVTSMTGPPYSAFSAYSVSAHAIVYDAAAPLGSERLLWLDRRSIVRDSAIVPSGALTFALSHDGRRVAFGGFGLWVYDRERRVTTTVATSPVVGQAMNDPTWDPGDSLLAYRTSFAGTPSIRLFHVSTGSSDSVFAMRDRVAMAQGWSPDGQSIAFTLRSGPIDTREEIWVYSLRERRAVRPWVPKANEASPRWSPDGHWFAYHSDESGAPEVYLRDVTGRGAAVRVSTAGGQFPRWSADGRALYYRAPNGSIMEVQVRLSPRLTLSTPEIAVNGAPFGTGNRTFEPVSNGEQFVAYARGDAPVFTLLLDWQERLRH